MLGIPGGVWLVLSPIFLVLFWKLLQLPQPGTILRALRGAWIQRGKKVYVHFNRFMFTSDYDHLYGPCSPLVGALVALDLTREYPYSACTVMPAGGETRFRLSSEPSMPWGMTTYPVVTRVLRLRGVVWGPTLLGLFVQVPNYLIVGFDSEGRSKETA